MRAHRANRIASLRLMLMALLVALLVTPARPAAAETATVAVAANFREALTALAPLFQAQTGHEITIVGGATGLLYAQISHGAPFDVYLAADAERPARAEAAGLAVPGAGFTYAIGRLTLYSPDPARVTGPEALEGDFRTLATADPKLAPYGAAAMDVLDRLGLRDQLQGRIAQAQNIGGAFAATRSGAAELGFVALASVLSPNNDAPGSRWDPPPDLYPPIRQNAALLTRGAGNPAALAFMAFLRGASARAVIRRYGYALEPNGDG